MASTRRAVRIAGKQSPPTYINNVLKLSGCSGSVTDRRDAMRQFAMNYPNDLVDVIIGDWMSEANMTARAVSKIGSSEKGTGQNTPFDSRGAPAYEPTFLEALEPALPYIAKHKIKLAVNAGASDTQLLHSVVEKLVKDKNLDLKVAWISGDEVFPAVQKALASKKSKFENICTGETLEDWEFEPIYAQAYLGGLGIAAAFAKGADIVVCSFRLLKTLGLVLRFPRSAEECLMLLLLLLRLIGGIIGTDSTLIASPTPSSPVI